MSNNKANNSVHSYLNSASLFRNKKKDLYNSSYVTHNRYFDDQFRTSSNVSNSTAIKMPNITHSKKQSHFPQEIDKGQNQLRISEQLSSREEEQIFQKQLQIFGSILASKENEKANQDASQIEKQPITSHQVRLQKEAEQILSESLRGSKKEISKEVKKDQNQIKMQTSKQLLNKSDKQMKVIIKTASNHIKQQAQEMSQCNKIEAEDSNNINPSEGKKSLEYINPYEPASNQKKQQVFEQEQPQQLTIKKMIYQQSHTISSIQPTKNPREANSKQESQQSQDNLLNVRREISNYLGSLKYKLQGSLICLETLQGQFDIIMDKTLQLQCERLKGSLYKLIEEQISNLKEFQKREMLKNKFYFMSQLYEMKCNIQLRSQQIENLQTLIKNDYRWKESIHSVINNSYSESINSIIIKSQQIQADLTAELDINLVHFTQTKNKQLINSIRSVVCDQFQKHRQQLNRNKQKSLLLKNQR